jgi:hypothetical protein
MNATQSIAVSDQHDMGATSWAFTGICGVYPRTRPEDQFRWLKPIQKSWLILDNHLANIEYGKVIEKL